MRAVYPMLMEYQFDCASILSNMLIDTESDTNVKAKRKISTARVTLSTRELWHPFHQVSRTGVCASLRFLFAFSGHFECRDVARAPVSEERQFESASNSFLSIARNAAGSRT